jgi:hypothetical protein
MYFGTDADLHNDDDDDDEPTNVLPIQYANPAADSVRLQTGQHHIADVTEWIRTTMTPDIAAYALVLTTGARFRVPAARLMGRGLEFAELRAMIRTWDLRLWLSQQFHAIDSDPSQELSAVQHEAWVSTMEEIADLEQAIDEKISELRG